MSHYQFWPPNYSTLYIDETPYVSYENFKKTIAIRDEIIRELLESLKDVKERLAKLEAAATTTKTEKETKVVEPEWVSDLD